MTAGNLDLDTLVDPRALSTWMDDAGFAPGELDTCTIYRVAPRT